MVEYSLQLDSVFGSLADPVRRDILRQITGRELSVSEIAHSYDMSLAAISKHLKILEKARLVYKRRHGKQRIVCLSPQPFAEACEFLQMYQQGLEARMDSLESYLKKGE